MKRCALLLLFALGVFGLPPAIATTVVGDLNNFDTINDTGQICYGFEIELDDVVSTDITYTFDWNHYGAPKIYQAQSSTAKSGTKVVVRYESTRDANGWGASGSFTNTAIPSLSPPAGHTCTDVTVNEGCEHFGLGYYGTPTAIRYNWLVVDGTGNGLVPVGTPVGVAAPKFTWTPPAPGVAAQVVAAIPAPAVAPPANKKFGEPVWVKVIKTTTHNAKPVALGDLISDDFDKDGRPDWTNGEPDEVETEWRLLQENTVNRVAKLELVGAGDAMPNGDEQVTRRYEFYRYGAAPDTLDGETGEAMCDAVDPATDPADPAYLHGEASMDYVSVTDAKGVTQHVNCAAQVVVGTYIGAQMAGFAAAAPLGLIENLQAGEKDVLYTARTVIVGGDTPFQITISGGDLPGGMSIDPETGVLGGQPVSGGDFAFTLNVTDAANATTKGSYALHIAGPAVAGYGVAYNGNGNSGGLAPADASTYASGATVTVKANSGALARTGYTFAGWNTKAAGTGTDYAATGNATFPMGGANVTLYAKWTINSYTVSFDSQGGPAVSSQTVAYNGKATKPVDPTRVGYTFGGWYTNNPPTTAYDFNTAVTANVTLYAAWIPLPTVQFGAATYSLGEAGGSISIPVNRTGSTAGTSTVNYATANGTATAGSDYTAASGTLTFAAGDTTKNVVVAITNDTTLESDETFTVTLSSPTGATLGVPAATTVSILDNDGGTALTSGVAVGGLSGAKSSSTYFNIDVPAGMASLTVTTSGATGNVDLYVRAGALPTTTTYTCRSITTTSADSCAVTNPAAGRYYVMLRGTSAYSGVSLVATYAAPPAPTVAFGAASYSVNENGGSVTIPVNRSGSTTGTSTVNYATANGTATAGSDYTATSGTLTFAAGVTTQNIVVPILDDAAIESNETFTVTLSNPGGAALGTPGATTVTIVDNDTLPTVQFGAATYSVTEGTASVTIPVTRSGYTGGTSTVAYRSADGTATAGSDYTAASGTLTFAAGVATQNIVIAIANDTAPELSETFTVTLSGPGGATLGTQSTTTVTIVDNDSGTALANGVAVGGLSGAKSSSTYFNIDVPAGMASLTVTTSGGSGNVDLYVRVGALPTTTAYTCRSITTTNADSCTVTNPAGRYYVMLRGTSAYSGVSLVARFQ